MQIVDLKKDNHKEVLRLAAAALRSGKVVVYPTDTSYGLGGLAENSKAIKKIYKIKERDFKKPVHVLVPSLTFAKRLVIWNQTAQSLADKFLPGPLTLVLPLKLKDPNLVRLSAKTGYLGIRFPKNDFALALAKMSHGAITAPSANPSGDLSGGYDPYNVKDVIEQFKGKKYQPDLIINAGKLKKVRPSTVAKITGVEIEVLRKGPINLSIK